MTECSAQQSFGFHPDQPVVVSFDAPEISSDGGALLLRQLDEDLGLTERMASCLSDSRDPQRVRHTRCEQLRQRVFQVALGYEDGNDADFLRHDPVLQTVCDRAPDDAEGLSSQPTVSRFENAVDGLSLRRLLRRFECDYVASLPTDTEVVVLDIDSTDDPTHGQQELSFFHGYYDARIYHPLLIFDGDSGQLVTALLRPGRAHASRGAVLLLRRLIRRIKRRFPQAAVVVRGDSHFAGPKILKALERLDAKLGGVDYLLGFRRNAVLERKARALSIEAQEISERRGGSTVQRFGELPYRAKSWSQSRRVVVRAEHNEYWGTNPRFVITSIEGFDPETLYRAYCQRGDCENRIKDLKNALAADRLSCSRFCANFFRLLLHAIAYRLLHELRRRLGLLGHGFARLQFDTLRLRLLKVAAWVKRSTRRIWVRLPHCFPHKELFCALAQPIDPPPAPG